MIISLVGLSNYCCEFGRGVGGEFDRRVDGPADEEPGVAAHRPQHVQQGEGGELPLPEEEGGGHHDHSQLQRPRQPQVDGCAQEGDSRGEALLSFLGSGALICGI